MLQNPEKFVQEFEIRSKALLDYSLVMTNLNNIRCLFKYHFEYIFDPRLSHESLIDYICKCIDLEDEEIQKLCLVMLREISFNLKKVLDNKLQKLLSTLFTLYVKTENEDIKRQTEYTLRTLSKYSSDIKMLHYIILMPKTMFTRYKGIVTICIKFLTKNTHLNILIFEEKSLAKLIQICARLYDDKSEKISQLGEEIVCNTFLRFKDKFKASYFLTILEEFVDEELAHKVIKLLKLNFDDIEGLIKNNFEVEKVEKAKEFEKLQEEREMEENVFRRSGSSILLGRGAVGMKERKRKQDFLQMGNQQSRNYGGKRNFELQDKLMNEIENLLKE